MDLVVRRVRSRYNNSGTSYTSFGTNESVVVLRDLNARVGNEVIERIVGQYGVPEEMKWAKDYWRCV